MNKKLLFLIPVALLLIGSTYKPSADMELDTLTATDFLRTGTLNVDESTIGESINIAGHEGVSIFHDGTEAFITSVDSGGPWHDLTFEALNVRFDLNGVENVIVVGSSGLVTVADLGGLVVGHTAQLTTTGVSALQILGTGSGDGVITTGRFSADDVATGIHFIKSRAAIGSFTIVEDNDRVGALEYYPDDGVDYSTVAARFRAEVDDASPEAGFVGIAFTWEQQPGGNGNALAETMRLAATGDLSVTGDINTTAWTAFTSTIVGWEDPLATHALVNYKKVGNLVYVQFYLEGVSDTTAVTFTLPFTQISTNGVELKVAIQVQDNGTISTTAGLLVLAANSATVSCFKDMAGAVWTNSGTKRVQGQFWYEAQ